MKEQKRQLSNGIIIRAAVAVLFVALIVLTICTIYTISWSNSGADAVSFDLAKITNEAWKTDINAAKYLVPEFIGVTTGGERIGISVSYNIVSELYRVLLSTIYTGLAESVSLPDDKWDDYTSEKNSVYIKYHTELPDGLICLFAGMYLDSNETLSPRFEMGIREIFIIPYSSEPYETILAVRNTSGDVRKYVIPSSKNVITISELDKFVRSYGSSMYHFIFNEGNYSNVSYTEPVYLDTIITRTVIMTKDTAALVQNSSDEREALLRVFGFNPDKILNTHVEDDGSSSYYDTGGILYLRDSEFEYVKASADSGIKVSDIIGGTESVGLEEYIHAALTLFDGIDGINKYYTGGDAEILLASASSEGGNVTLRFAYVIDNIPISDVSDAFVVSFENGVISHVLLHTIAVRILGDRNQSYSEWWFLSLLKEYSCNVRMVYKSDYVSESVTAEWSAEILESDASKKDEEITATQEESESGK